MYNNIVYKYYTTIMYNFNGYIYTLLKNYRSHRSQYIKKAFIYAGYSWLRSDYDKFSIVVKRSQHSRTIPVNIWYLYRNEQVIRKLFTNTTNRIDDYEKWQTGWIITQ